MAKIQIDEKWRISSDPHQWTVQEFMGVRTNGQEDWKNRSYHAEITAAVRWLFGRLLRDSNADGATEVLAEMKRIATTLTDAVRPLVTVEIRSCKDEFTRRVAP